MVTMGDTKRAQIDRYLLLCKEQGKPSTAEIGAFLWRLICIENRSIESVAETYGLFSDYVRDLTRIEDLLPPGPRDAWYNGALRFDDALALVYMKPSEQVSWWGKYLIDNLSSCPPKKTIDKASGRP
jgi:hypothetical protein